MRMMYETNYSNDASSYTYLIPYCYANAYIMSHKG